jgi:hypothetical protein
MDSLIQNLRSYKILDISIFDVVLSFSIAFLLKNFLIHSLRLFKNETQLYASIIPLGVLVHYIFNIPTKFNQYLFQDKNFIAQLVLIIDLIIFFK